MIATFHLSPILHCLPPLSYFQHHKIQMKTTLLGRFHLSSDLSQTWKDFILVSDMQKRVHDLALKIEFSSLTNTTLFATSIVLPTPQNTADNSLSGSIPPELGSISPLEKLYLGKCDDKRVVYYDYDNDFVPMNNINCSPCPCLTLSYCVYHQSSR